MIFQVILFAMLNGSYAKIGQHKPVFNVNSSRKLSTCGTHNTFEDYEATSVSMIPSMDGQKVAVTSKVSPDPLAACTIMLCDESDPCCNSCNSGMLMGDIKMDSDDLRCSGTECDFTEKCTYMDGDVITVYGTVSGSSIKVDSHCLVGSQQGLMPKCGEPREGYTEVDAESIGPDMMGQNVMITSSVQTPEFAACTRMGCPPENSCCNNCHADPFIGNGVYLISPDSKNLGCHGNECDWNANCIYSSSDIVTVYGQVGDQGNIINVHDHCKVA